MTIRRLILASLILSIILILFVRVGYQSNSVPTNRCAELVAKELGIHWSYEDGATEQLDAFQDGVIQCNSVN